MCAVVALGAVSAHAATEQAKQAAIDAGLLWLSNTQTTSGSEGYWSYNNNGTLAATASAALAFIEEGYLPGDGSVYDPVVTKACTYVFNRTAAQSGFGWETAVYARHAEDYNNDGVLNDGGNNQALYFNPGAVNRTVYTTGIVTPMVYALGEALGQNTTVGTDLPGVTSVAGGMTYKQVMRDVVDWFSYAQVEPNRGVYRGGWRYQANEASADNSTAQWGALPILYAQSLGMPVPQYVKNELALWTAHVQHGQDGTWRAGGSGYTGPNDYVNICKAGGLMLELAAIGAGLGDPRVQNALGYIESTVSFDHWNQGYVYNGDQWHGGHLDNPYAMWAVYKALQYYGISTIATAPGGFTIGQDWAPTTSAPGDWFSHYCDLLVNIQNADGSWNGVSGVWYGPLATGWYVNILNAAGAPPPVIPEPVTMAGLALGLGGLVTYVRRRRR
jgi:hypothetical protein